MSARGRARVGSLIHKLQRKARARDPAAARILSSVRERAGASARIQGRTAGPRASGHLEVRERQPTDTETRSRGPDRGPDPGPDPGPDRGPRETESAAG